MNSFKRKILSIKIFLAFFCISLVGYIFLRIYEKEPTVDTITTNNPTSEPIAPELVNKENKILTKYQKHHTKIENTEVLAEKLTFTSKTDDNNPYLITADRAIKTVDGKYTLSNIMAEVGIEGEILKVGAEEGFYNDKVEELILSNKIEGSYLGYILNANILQINLKTKNLEVPDKVSIEEENITISADKLYTEGDKIIKFEGHVKTSINFSK